MSTNASIGIIRKSGEVQFTTLVNDGNITVAGKKLVEFYNSRNAARLLVSLGIISTLTPRLQDTITHHVHFMRSIDAGHTFPSFEAFLGFRTETAFEDLYLYDEREYCDSIYEEQYNYVTDSTVKDPCFWKYMPGTVLLNLRDVVHEAERVNSAL